MLREGFDWKRGEISGKGVHMYMYCQYMYSQISVSS